MNHLRALEPRGEIETLQKMAALDVGRRTEFWRRLLHIDVWVLGTCTSGTQLVLHTWKGREDTCAVFTSRVLLENVMEPNSPWLQLNARVAFGAMAVEGLGTFVNPRYEFQVRLRSTDLDALLAERFDDVQGTDA
jgi:hypothetical protein